ncbi:MAG: hypothetical protein NVSMB39_5550 [Candidatus Saccharimonadales bacterium]
MRRNGSIISTLYVLVGIILAFVWGQIPAAFHALAAQDLTGFLMGVLRALFVVFLWLIMLIFHIAVPF